MNGSRQQGRLAAVKVALQVVLGGRELSLEELSRIGEGSIIALDRLAGEPLAVNVSGEQIGWGEVVVIDENFGVRITEILGGRAGSGGQV
jgi:flagellar motor switch protein FliN/FliY